jgi:hypothetical protein
MRKDNLDEIYEPSFVGSIRRFKGMVATYGRDRVYGSIGFSGGTGLSRRGSRVSIPVDSENIGESEIVFETSTNPRHVDHELPTFYKLWERGKPNGGRISFPLWDLEEEKKKDYSETLKRNLEKLERGLSGQT